MEGSERRWRFLRQPTILVTGGAGYIGSICSAQLIERGYRVVVVDNLSTGFREAVPDSAAFYQGDIGDSCGMARILRDHDVEVVFHFAAKALIPESVTNPGLFFKENVASGVTFLEELRRARVRKFIFSSTAAVYGEPTEVPIPEHHATSPMNSYGETKLIFERVLGWYVRAYKWGVAAMRYFNASGACLGRGEMHDPETHIIPLLFQTATKLRDEFRIFGTDYPTPDGTCIRDFVHVADIADAHIRAMQLLDSPRMIAFNIGTGLGHSVREVIDEVTRVTGERLPVRAAERRLGDPAVLCANPQLLMRTLGWKPQHSDLRNIVETAWQFHQGTKECKVVVS